jgi:hypothetical protein
MVKRKAKPDERLKKSFFDDKTLIEQRRDDQKEFRQRAYDMKLAKREEKEKKQHQEASKALRGLRDAATEAIKRPMHGPDHFGSVMSAMLSDLLLVAEWAGLCNPIGWAAGKIFLPVSDFLGDKLNIVWDAAGNKLGDLLGNAPHVSTPDLQYFVDLNPNGTLAVHSLGGNLRRSDGKPITPEQEAFFEKGVATWIKTAQDGNYRLKKRADSSYEIIERATGKKLNRDEFLQLRDHPVHGMKAFMETRFDLMFEQLDEKPEDDPRLRVK